MKYNKSVRFRYVSLLLFAISVCYPLSCSKAATKLRRDDKILAIQAFGDSYLDTGNNNALISITRCNFPPFGRDFIGGKPTGRFSNGRLFSDMIAEALGIKYLVPPYRGNNFNSSDLQTGLCFASGGSGYDPLSSTINQVIPFLDQVKDFREYKSKLEIDVGRERSEEIIANSLFLISGGTNDVVFSYFGSIFRKFQYDIPAYADHMVQLASNFYKELYNLGARKFAIINVPPLGCFPLPRTFAGGLTRQCAEKYTKLSQLFDTKLSQRLNSLTLELPNSTMVYLDYYEPLLDIILNPTKYGFEVTTKGCCGTGLFETAIFCNKFSPGTCSDTSDYIFFDSIHPTEKAFKIIVSTFISQLYDY